VHQQIPRPLYAHYAVSKAGLEMLTKTLALEYASKGIRVNAVAPGAIKTPINKDVLESSKELKKLIKKIPIGRMGKPEEIAFIVTFLCSEKASYVTGSTYFADGGLTLYPSFCINCREVHT
jgi:glucose 1-dehydrogenase